MQDGLYLDGVWVAQPATSLNLQINDLTKPDTIQATYSNTFQIPDSLTVRDLTLNAEQVDSGGPMPYKLLTARLLDQGEVIFTGHARLTSFRAGWSVLLVQAGKSLFDELTGKSLRSLDLTRYDHKWDVATITALGGAESGVVYPVIDYGLLAGDVFPLDCLFPSIYTHTLIGQMLKESGYRAAGDWLEDELLKRLALPFTNDEATDRDDEWVSDRTASVTLGGSATAAGPLNIILPFVIDDDGVGYYDGRADNFKPNLNAYVADTGMRLRVEASISFSVKIDFGSVEALLIIEKNGVNVGQAYFSASGPRNPSFTKTDVLSVNELVTCRKGDQIRLRYIIRKRSTVAQWAATTRIAREDTWATFKPDSRVYPGDNWPVARNLPDMSCADLLKSIALMSSATYKVDDLRKTVTLIPLDSILANREQAFDLSTRVEESEEPELSVMLEPYGQKNFVRWAGFDFPVELARTKINSANKATVVPRPLQLGDGVISCDAANLPAYAELFELPFAACQNSDATLGGYGNPVLIRTRRLSGTTNDTARTVEQEATTPRLVLIEPSLIVTAQANTVTADGVIRNQVVSLTACHWGERAAGAKHADNENNFTLAFDRMGVTHREQTLIQRCFQGLRRVLRRPRQLTLPVYLSPEDIATLSKDGMLYPVRIRGVRCGALVINDSYCYINKVSGYIAGQPCSISVIPF
jgi:hypothetical protein